MQHTFDVDSLVFAMPVGDAGMKPPRCTMALSRTLRWELDHSASSETNDKYYSLTRVDDICIHIYFVSFVSFDVVDEGSL